MIAIVILCVFLSLLCVFQGGVKDAPQWRTACFLSASVLFALLAAVCVSGLLERLAT